MKSGFKNILVPLFPSVNARVAFRRALKMCDVQSSAIHLVNVQNRVLSTADRVFNYSFLATRKLINEWQTFSTFNKGIQVKVEYEQAATIIDAIVLNAKREQPDLIVIGSSLIHLYPGNHNLCTQLAELTDSTVLRIQKGVNAQTTVVVPLDNEVTESAMEKISMANRKLTISVHLLKYTRKDKDDVKSASIEILKSYQSINALSCPVGYSIARGESRQKAIENYVREIKSDVLLIST